MAKPDPDSELTPPGWSPSRKAAVVIALAWLAIQVAVPARYYFSDDIYDERFAWRMFSAVRVQDCNVTAREVVGGMERPIQLSSVLPLPWITLLQRNRPAVVARFLAWRCASDAEPSEVRLATVCRDAQGTVLPAVHRTRHCESGEVEETEEAEAQLAIPRREHMR